jgi:hypothetical protein
LAAPETQFGRAGIQATGYTPVVTQLNSPIQLPGTGELWAQVGKTALEAGRQIQESALNPAVREQMKYAIENYKRGEDIIAHHRAMGEKGYFLGRATPQGAEEISPAETGKFGPLFWPSTPPPPGTPPPPPAPKTAPGTGKEPLEQTTPQPSEQPKEDDLETGPKTTSTDTGGSNLAASTHNDFLLRRMMQEREAAGLSGSEAAPQGTPSGMTFTNPATGNVQPLQTPSVFAPQAAAPPPAAPTPAPTQAPSAISQVTPQPGVALANWQNQNVHPVIAPKAVLDAVKTNVSTAAQDATYLPSGGVNGEPAWAIHMKGGGQTTISASQLATSPWGRVLMATHNASEVMEAQANQAPQPQPGQGQTNQPGNMLLQAPPGQAGQPPQEGPQQPAPLAPPPAPEAYNAAAYQMPQGPTITQAGEVNPALMAGGSNEQAAQAATPPPPPATQPPRSEIRPLSDDDKAIATPEAIAAARANAKLDPNQPTNEGDPHMGELGPWHLYRDDKFRTGELYAVRPGLTSLFKQQRYILGSDGWQEYELPDTNIRLNVEGEFGGGKGGVVGAVMPDGMTFRGKNTFPSMSNEEIAKLSVPAMKKWLDAAGKYHNTNGEPNSTMVARLSDLVDISQRTQRMIDGNTVALQEEKDPGEYNRNAQYLSGEARERNKLLPAGGYPEEAWWNPGGILTSSPGQWTNRLQYEYHDMMSQGKPVNNFSDYLEEQVRRMNDSMGQTPLRQAAVVTPQQQKEGPSLTVYGPWGIGGKLQAGSSDTSSVSPHIEVNKQFEATNKEDQKAAIKGLQQVKSDYDRQFIESYEDAVSHNFRLPPQATLYYHALKQAGTFPDKGNQFRDDHGRLINPFRTTAAATTGAASASAKPSSALPQISQYDTKEFDRLGIKKGDQYLGPDGRTIYTRGE